MELRDEDDTRGLLCWRWCARVNDTGYLIGSPTWKLTTTKAAERKIAGKVAGKKKTGVRLFLKIHKQYNAF